MPQSRSRGVLAASALSLGFWTVHGLASGSQYYALRHAEGNPVTWRATLPMAMASAYLWVPVTLAAVWLTWRLPLDRGVWPRRLPVYLGAALGVTLFRAGAVVLLDPWIGWYETMPPFSSVLLSNFVQNFFLFLLLVGVAHALFFARRSRQREQLAERLRSDLVESQLRVLRSQLQPHFLFNTLNTIATLVHEDAAAAERMIARLSHLLRRSLEQAGADEVELREELAFVSDYLEIERVRFEDRLNVRWHVDPDATRARVPPLLLQPLVENAIRHGLAPRSAPGTLDIECTRSNGTLRLCVRDDGVGIRDVPRGSRDGVGIRASRERLAKMYGADQRFSVAPLPGGGTVVQIEVPFRVFGDRSRVGDHGDDR